MIKLVCLYRHTVDWSETVKFKSTLSYIIQPYKNNFTLVPQQKQHLSTKKKTKKQQQQKSLYYRLFTGDVLYIP